NAIAPVVLIGEATAGIANHARLELLQAVHQLFAQTGVIRHTRILADPDAVVYDAAQMLDEVTIDISIHCSDRLIEQDFDARIGGSGAARNQQSSSAGCQHAADKRSAV